MVWEVLGGAGGDGGAGGVGGAGGAGGVGGTGDVTIAPGPMAVSGFYSSQ